MSFCLRSKMKKAKGAVDERGCRIFNPHDSPPRVTQCTLLSALVTWAARYLCSRLPPLHWGLHESKGMFLKASLNVSSTPSLLPSSELVLKTYLLNDSKMLLVINQEG